MAKSVNIKREITELAIWFLREPFDHRFRSFTNGIPVVPDVNAVLAKPEECGAPPLSAPTVLFLGRVEASQIAARIRVKGEEVDRCLYPQYKPTAAALWLLSVAEAAPESTEDE